MAYNDTTLLVVSDADASKRARFNAASITPGQTRVITIPDQDITLGAGGGDVVGPASATDNAITRFDGTTGKLLQNSAATLDDAGAMSAASLALTTDLAVADGGTGAGTAATARANLSAAPNTPKFVVVSSDAELPNGRTAAVDANSGIGIAESAPSLVYSLAIQSLTALTATDKTADYAVVYDASAGVHKKVLLTNLAATHTGRSEETGTPLLDFGAFPGVSDVSIEVTGQTDILATSYVQAWLRPVDTDDHTADEHLVETLRIEAGNIVPGVGFTIYGFNTNQLSERLIVPDQPRAWYFSSASVLTSKIAVSGRLTDVGGKATRIYGKWAIQWRWS